MKEASFSNIYEYINRRYNEETRKCLSDYFSAKKKYEKITLDIEFLVKCKIYDVFPKFLRFKLHRRSLKSHHFYRAWQSKLLNKEISLKRRNKRNLTERLTEKRNSLNSVISKLDIILVDRHIQKCLKSFINSAKATHESKLRNLGINNSLEHTIQTMLYSTTAPTTCPNK